MEKGKGVIIMKVDIIILGDTKDGKIKKKVNKMLAKNNLSKHYKIKGDKK